MFWGISFGEVGIILLLLLFFFSAWRLPPAEVGGLDMFKHTRIKPCQSFEAHLVNKLGHHAQHQPCEMLSLCCR